jgi:hypothetical protein
VLRIGHNLHVPSILHLSKHVVAFRWIRQRHWVATVGGRSAEHNDRMMEVLYDAVTSSDYSAQLQIAFEPKRILSQDEESER